MKIIIAVSLIIFHFMFLLHLSKNNNLFLIQYPMENMIKKGHHLIMIINKIKTKYHKHLQVIIIKTITSVDKNYNGLQNKNKKEILLMRIAIRLNRLMMLNKNNQNIISPLLSSKISMMMMISLIRNFLILIQITQKLKLSKPTKIKASSVDIDQHI